MKQINEFALANAVGITSALVMLALTGFGNMGFYSEVMRSMMQRHMFYGPTFGGLFGGMIEAFVVSFILTYTVAWFYNKLSK